MFFLECELSIREIGPTEGCLCYFKMLLLCITCLFGDVPIYFLKVLAKYDGESKPHILETSVTDRPLRRSDCAISHFVVLINSIMVLPVICLKFLDRCAELTLTAETMSFMVILFCRFDMIKCIAFLVCKSAGVRVF